MMYGQTEWTSVIMSHIHQNLRKICAAKKVRYIRSSKEFTCFQQSLRSFGKSIDVFAYLIVGIGDFIFVFLFKFCFSLIGERALESAFHLVIYSLLMSMIQ